ncbi:MAG: methylthioribulose 1-phosphate dehydratase [Bacteroidetes bacterium]|nr:methylthioribulose 1-phosphate dehydratase [Bacteroidota bacterium]
MMNINQLKNELLVVIKNLHNKGWSPATSTNYSFKDKDNQIWVTRSGVDKSSITSEDFITISTDGNSMGEYVDCVPSAESVIHCVLYEIFPETKFILHSHGPFPVLISSRFKSELKIQGYELQKGFPNTRTHQTESIIPIFFNNQDMGYFKQELVRRKLQLKNNCFIIEKHGTYAWGNTLFDAKKHLETLDYLCQCEFLNGK